jgi:hypothetical protein
MERENKSSSAENTYERWRDMIEIFLPNSIICSEKKTRYWFYASIKFLSGDVYWLLKQYIAGIALSSFSTSL